MSELLFFTMLELLLLSLDLLIILVLLSGAFLVAGAAEKGTTRHGVTIGNQLSAKKKEDRADGRLVIKLNFWLLAVLTAAPNASGGGYLDQDLDFSEVIMWTA